MNDSVLVEVLEGVDNLNRVALHLQFVQTLPPPKQLVHALVRAQLQQNIHVLGVFEEVLKLNHSRVVNGPMNFNFTHQLLLGSTLGQGGLLDDFARGEDLCLLVNHFVALGETSFAQELPPHVLFNLDLAIVLNYLFFNENLLVLFHFTSRIYKSN
jgi:hypothetical protein